MDSFCRSKAKVRGEQEGTTIMHGDDYDDDDDDDGGGGEPEGDQVVLHEWEDLGVELRVAGKHLQGLVDKPAKLLF